MRVLRNVTAQSGEEEKDDAAESEGSGRNSECGHSASQGLGGQTFRSNYYLPASAIFARAALLTRRSWAPAAPAEKGGSSQEASSSRPSP